MTTRTEAILQHSQWTDLQPFEFLDVAYRLMEPQKPVNVHLIVNEGEVGVIKNLERKQKQCENMFDSLVKHMGQALAIESELKFEEKERVPEWLNLTATV